MHSLVCFLAYLLVLFPGYARDKLFTLLAPFVPSDRMWDDPSTTHTTTEKSGRWVSPPRQSIPLSCLVAGRSSPGCNRFSGTMAAQRNMVPCHHLAPRLDFQPRSIDSHRYRAEQ